MSSRRKKNKPRNFATSSNRPASSKTVAETVDHGSPEPTRVPHGSVPPEPSFWKSPRGRAFVITIGFAAMVAGGVFADYWTAKPEGITPTFVGRDSCVQCHQEEVDAFHDSDHDRAMDVATDDTVLGDFDDVIFEHDGIKNRLFRDGDRFMVHTEGEDGMMRDFEVKYVFGVYPLQQYMVEFDREEQSESCEVARLQVLRISWDSRDHRWFYLRPPDVADKLAADDPLHWTGIAQRWQTMCADCHSTNLKRHFDPETVTYHTTFSEIDVSCEACHGPASLHVELANEKSLFWDRRYGYGLVKLKGNDPEPQLQTCAPCHSRRGLLDDELPGGAHFHDHFRLETLGDATYHGDGQIKDEVYVYGSFIQSKMYHKDIRCTDCHDPHSLKLKYPGNQTCTSCHQHAAGKYDVVSHHHHEPGSEGSKCVNCHMPHTTYMEVDPRRDHSLRIPRPDLSVTLGTPNACSHCHVNDRLPEMAPAHRDQFQAKEYSQWLLAAEQDPKQAVGLDGQSLANLIQQTDRWCDEACDRWYGENRKREPHFSEALVPLRRGDPQGAARAIEFLAFNDHRAPAIVKATLLEELARQQPRGEMMRGSELIKAANGILDDNSEHPLVRSAAASILPSTQSSRTSEQLIKLLEDPSKLVRNTAARTLVHSVPLTQLTSTERSKLIHALDDVRKEMMVTSDRAGAHMGWALICERLQRYGEAIESYQTAIRIEPNTTGPRSNLAALLENLAQRAPSGEREMLLKRVQKLRKESLPLMARDAKLAPKIAGIQYQYGLALYLDGQHAEALTQLQRALDLEPDNEDFQLAVRLLKEKIAEQQ